MNSKTTVITLLMALMGCGDAGGISSTTQAIAVPFDDGTTSMCPDGGRPPCDCDCGKKTDGTCRTCPPTVFTPPTADGTLLKDPGGEIDVIYGKARFHINSVTEFFAMGFDPAKVIVLPSGMLFTIGTIPEDGTMLKDRTQYEIYLIELGKKLRMRNADDVNRHGGFGAVRIVPEHALDGLPTG